jgi:hypothetical protein
MRVLDTLYYTRISYRDVEEKLVLPLFSLSPSPAAGDALFARSLSALPSSPVTQGLTSSSTAHTHSPSLSNSQLSSFPPLSPSSSPTRQCTATPTTTTTAPSVPRAGYTRYAVLPFQPVLPLFPRLTRLSPLLCQVEYALEAVKQGSACVGLRSNTHVILLGLKVSHRTAWRGEPSQATRKRGGGIVSTSPLASRASVCFDCSGAPSRRLFRG